MMRRSSSVADQAVKYRDHIELVHGKFLDTADLDANRCHLADGVIADSEAAGIP